MSTPLVYIIDDDIELSKVIAQRFVSFGCKVKTFSNPTDLFLAFDENKPNLQLVDLNLGDGLSGFDIIKKIRNEYNLDLPILILTGVKDTKQVAHGLEVGANDYIIKPPLRVDFKEIISQYITSKNLPGPSIGVFQPVKSEKMGANLKFQISIEEVNLVGFILQSDHLIKKGASFFISGRALNNITPTCDLLFVRVISSASVLVGDMKKYQIKVEVDGSQEQALREIRNFLTSKIVN